MPRRAEYRALLTEAYDLDKPTAPEAELAFWRTVIARAGASGPAGPVLELMCGSGRFLLPLLADGVDVDGVDASPEMLAACVRTAGAQGLDVTGRLREQRAEAMDVGRRYAVAFCAAGSFGLIADDADVAEALRRIHDHLLPGGTAVLEVETSAARVRSDGRLAWWRRADGAVITLRGGTRFDDATGVEEGVGIYELWVGSTLDRTELDEWVCRFWTAPAIAEAVTTAGFADVAVLRGGSDDPADPGDALLTVVAHRA